MSATRCRTSWSMASLLATCTVKKLVTKLTVDARCVGASDFGNFENSGQFFEKYKTNVRFASFKLVDFLTVDRSALQAVEQDDEIVNLFKLADMFRTAQNTANALDDVVDRGRIVLNRILFVRRQQT